MAVTPPATDPGVTEPASIACVILAHADPVHVKRLVAALDPFPTFLHCDASTSDEVFVEMTRGLPDRCTVLDRMSTGWAKWENVAAELAGYRAALATTSVTHLALLTGTDYPLASAADITATLERYRGMSLTQLQPLPHSQWGRSGGFDRLRYRHWAYRKHMIRLPIPRKLPSGIVYSGGSQLKILARHHAQAVVSAEVDHPDLVQFWRRSWVADETFVPSMLSTPSFVPDWSQAHVDVTPWWIGWDGTRQKSPPWLDMRNWPELKASRSTFAEQPRLFARKFSTVQSGEVLDAIDDELRGRATLA